MLLLLMCSATCFKDFGLGWCDWRRLGRRVWCWALRYPVQDRRCGSSTWQRKVPYPRHTPSSSHHLRQEEGIAHFDELTAAVCRSIRDKDLAEHVTTIFDSAWPSLTESFSSPSSMWTMSSGSPFAGKRKLQRRPSAS
jgi:hypothetical protein